MDTTTTTTSLNTDPLKLLNEETAKIPTYSGKLVKIQAQIDSLKEENNKIKDLDLPICKQFLDHGIKSLDLEYEKVLTRIKWILNESRITDVNELPEDIRRVFHNPSLAPTNSTGPHPQPQHFGLQFLPQQSLQQTELEHGYY